MFSKRLGVGGKAVDRKIIRLGMAIIAETKIITPSVERPSGGMSPLFMLASWPGENSPK
jgi:hypothetical protein